MNVFLHKFSSYILLLDSVILSKEHLLIIGVPNDPDSLKFLNMIDLFDLHQHVNMTTHIHGHTLDLVITRKTSTITQKLPRVDRHFSDHVSIVRNLRIKRPVSKVKMVTYRKH